MIAIDNAELAGVTGGIVEGGCVVTPPWFPPFQNPQQPKMPEPKGNPFDLSNIGTTRPK